MPRNTKEPESLFPPHLISFPSLLMMEIRVRIKLLTKRKARYAYIEMPKPVSPTISGS